MKGINTLRYSDIFLAMYSDNGSSCLHRNHSHVLVYMYSGELEIKEHEKVFRGIGDKGTRESHPAAQGGLCVYPQGFQCAAH